MGDVVLTGEEIAAALVAYDAMGRHSDGVIAAVEGVLAMRTGDTAPAAPIACARHAAEDIRTLNHLTIRGNGGLVRPSDLEDCVAALAQMAKRLPQALEQIGRIIREAADREGLYDDRGIAYNPRRVALAAAGMVADDATRAHASRLTDALTGAVSQLSHLGVSDA